MNRSPNALALTYKDAAVLVGVEYRTIKLGVERGTIPTVQLGPRRMIPPRGAPAGLRRRAVTDTSRRWSTHVSPPSGSGASASTT